VREERGFVIKPKMRKGEKKKRSEIGCGYPTKLNILTTMYGICACLVFGANLIIRRSQPQGKKLIRNGILLDL